MPDSPADIDPDAFERRFKEYQICREEAARLESYIWQTTSVFGIGSGAALGLVFQVAGRVPPLHHARLALAIITAFVINASITWWRFVRRWRSI
jgi:hypothetical protein